MKPNWKDGASASVKAQIEALLAEPWRMTDGRLSPGQSWQQAADLAWSVGCDIEPPTTPVSDRIAALKAAGDMREINRLYQLQGANFEAEQEQRNLVRWTAMRKFAAEPSREETAVADMKRAAEQAREAEIEARAVQLLAEQHRAALERCRARARKEAEAVK